MEYAIIISLALCLFRKGRHCYGWSILSMILCFTEWTTMTFDAIWLLSALAWAIAAGRLLFVSLALSEEEERIAELFRNGQYSTIKMF